MWIIYPIIFIAGFVDAIAGGGGLISLSGYYAIGLPPHIALATNKFSSTAGTVVSAGRYISSGHIKWKSAAVAAIGAIIGSALGARLALMLDERYLKGLMIILVPLVALFVLFKKDFGITTKKLSSKKVIAYSILTGLALGAYDGFFGPGTGTFLTIIFTAVIGFDVVTACGNTKVVNLASNLAAVITFMIYGDINYKIGIPAAICGILGNYLGAGIAIKKGVKIVRPMMLIVVALLLIKVGSSLV
ncbi:MAG: TSUP family transporter [Oscillospiraceae bacterium]